MFKTFTKWSLNNLCNTTLCHKQMPHHKNLSVWAGLAPTTRPLLSLGTLMWIPFLLLFLTNPMPALQSRASSSSHSQTLILKINLSSLWTCTAHRTSIIFFGYTSFVSPSGYKKPPSHFLQAISGLGTISGLGINICIEIHLHVVD